MNSTELKELRNKILNKEIPLSEAMNILLSCKKRSWYTREWKELRDKLIKNSCEQCGSREVLTIQHTWHPRDYKEVKEKILEKYFRITKNELEDMLQIHDDDIFELTLVRHSEDIEREIALTMIDGSLRYISLKDTKTFCRKCAFLWDEQGMDLCPVCKTRYKKFYHLKCADCAKEEKNLNGNENASEERLFKILGKLRNNG